MERLADFLIIACLVFAAIVMASFAGITLLALVNALKDTL